ncbi:MAG: hypothetical protein M3Y39_00270 [Chloroflexota bacterium]|nr:hypothetical protein [Chloroflexota bacterium]
MENGQRKKRGRPPGPRKITSPSEQKRAERRDEHRSGGNGTSATQKRISNGSLPGEAEVVNDEQLAYTLTDDKLTPFSSLLRNILRHDRSEIVRVARELEVAENTIYRWMNGSSEPRAVHLKRLPDVLIEHRSTLSYAINQTFPGTLDTTPTGIREVRKDIYRRVLELVATISEEDTRFWQVSQAIFEYALQHMDAERQGLAITFARLMPARKDGIHSLREAAMHGNPPWPFDIESKAYLGSTTLAGTAVTMQRMLVWNSVGSGDRLQVEVDDFEASACAVPVTRGNSIAGALIVSSTQPDFFNDPMASQAVLEYAQLLATALSEADFQPHSRLNLRPFPDLKSQREHITRSYVGRILTYARKNGRSRTEAELMVRAEMEEEFEQKGRVFTDQTSNEQIEGRV